MKFSYFTLISILSVGCAGLTSAQQVEEKKDDVVTTDISVVVPPQVSASAQQAVQTLGNKTKAGDFMFGLNTMYDRYKKRQEELHGKDKLREQFQNAGNKMMKLGVTIDRFSALRPTGFFRVNPRIKPDIKAKLATGELTETKPGDEYYHWMVIVPTTQEWRFLGKNGRPTRFLKREGFQIAISKETDLPGQEQWTFIGEVKEQELRSLFPSLPPNLKLPKLLDSEIEK